MRSFSLPAWEFGPRRPQLKKVAMWRERRGQSQLVWNGIIPGCKKIEGKSTTGNSILSTMYRERRMVLKKFRAASLSSLCKGEKAAGGGLFFGDGYGGG